MLNKRVIPGISKEALTEFQESSSLIIRETVIRSLKREDEIVQHGDRAEELLTKGLEFTAQMLEAAMSLGELPLLEDELLWAKDRLPHDGVKMEHVLVRLKIYRELIKESLQEEHTKEITPYLDWMIKRQEELIQKG